MSRNFSSLGVGLCLCLFLVYGCAAQRERSPDVVIPSAPVAPAARDGDLLSNEIDALESTGQIDKNLPGSAKADIAREYKKYLRKGRNNMCAISKQSEQYIAYARQVFKQKGMPEELANLALVESGYTPDAVSRAGAAGAWQFMPETGRNYGLTQDIWQDDRLDPYKSTEAAAEYLRKLYNDFGDWPTAIAAYNAGEGKLARAKAQAGARDFFEVTEKNHTLDEKTQLREETRNYVPRFLAVSKIMRNLEDLGFEPINPEKAEPVVRYAAKPGTDLKDLSRACNLPWEELAKLNKHHKRTITCTDRSTFVYVPAKARKLASSYFCSDQKANYAGWRFAKVAKGLDSLEKISKSSGVAIEKLRAANPGAGKLKTGQSILVPGNLALDKIRVATEDGKKKIKDAKTVAAAHIVQRGDTLYNVAKKYNVSVKELMEHNSIASASAVRLGQSLSIPGRGTAIARSQGSLGKKKTYTVQSKDNLWRIAKKHNISVDELKAWNNIDEKRLRPGLSLTVSR